MDENTGSVLSPGGRRPPWSLGVLVGVALVALSTGLVYPLKQVTAVSSLGVVYLLAVVIVSAFWGAWLGIATAVMSAAAFNFFHIPPVGRFTIADSRNWIALATFFVAAILTSTVSERARSRAIEAERRRAEADLTVGDGPAVARSERGRRCARAHRAASRADVRAYVGDDRAR